MKLIYPASISRDEENNIYIVKVPDIPGCEIESETLADAITKGIDAASSLLLDELENGRRVPKASPIESIRVEPGGFVNMLMMDVNTYAEKSNRSLLKKNVRIPQWLSSFADSQQINISEVLANTLTGIYEQQLAYEDKFERPPVLQLVQHS
ncbi:MAG: type II toxin-antitoxin system HicB family antitoxin [Clostridiales bacterium]|nr:type II toxin-antitoxin system HicB family antitoxin [Clostridiales bacterium]